MISTCRFTPDKVLCQTPGYRETGADAFMMVHAPGIPSGMLFDGLVMAAGGIPAHFKFPRWRKPSCSPAICCSTGRWRSAGSTPHV